MNRDTRYPSETYQCLPKDGYTQMFQNMLRHPNIHLHLSEKITSQEIHKKRTQYLFTLHSGAIDEFFDYTYGPLKYRSLKFQWKHFQNLNFYQPRVQMNFPNEHEFTRCVEMKHVTKQSHTGTTICLEYSSADGEPYYPMPLARQEQLYQKYKLLADRESHQTEHPIYFLGRLAEYKYYNMDHIFLRSMNWSKEKLNALAGK
jgi:UDP-galactopyranose mutase